MGTRVEVAVALQQPQHRNLLLLGRTLWIVGGEAVQHRPRVVAQLLPAERAFFWFALVSERTPEFSEGVILADELLAVLRHPDYYKLIMSPFFTDPQSSEAYKQER